MAQHTTFRIGGLADAWARVDDRQALTRVLQVCREAEVQTWLLGRGSNVLVSDQGLRGVVICLGGELTQIMRKRVQGFEGSGVQVSNQNPRTPEPQNPILVCGAGAALDAVATFAEKEGLVGAEFLAGIPGSVGGGLHSNAGAFRWSLGDVVTSVTALDSEGNEQTLTGTRIHREYRRPMIEEGLIAVSVMLELQERVQGFQDWPQRPLSDSARGPVPDTGILDSSTPGPLSVADIRKLRWSKHPKEPSAGSFFRNPDTGDGGRVPAGKLIEQCGLKGRTIGGARVSEKHANFLVNAGGARFADVYELVQVVKATVEEQTGILLEEEVQYLPGPGEVRGRGSGVRGFEGSGPIPEPQDPGTRRPLPQRR